MNRKLNKKKILKAGQKPVFLPFEGTDVEDSNSVEKGNCVDYHKYTLFFSLKQHSDSYDSIVVEYTSQYHWLTQYSESHLYQMLDTICNNDVLSVYIKNTLINEQHSANDLTWTRTRPICKVLHRTGIPRVKIKLLLGNESPPKL